MQVRSSHQGTLGVPLSLEVSAEVTFLRFDVKPRWCLLLLLRKSPQVNLASEHQGLFLESWTSGWGGGNLLEIMSYYVSAMASQVAQR